jgi:hypothetical protein
MVAYIVAEAFLTEIAEYLRSHPSEQVEISSLIKFMSCESTSENGEKAGNIVPMVELGEKFKLGIKNDSLTEEEEND